MRGIVLIDGNSLGFAAQSATKLTSGEQEVQAIFGFLKSLRVLAVKYPGRKLIVLWDGKSWRYDHFAGYKGKRSEDPKAVREKNSYKKQRPFIAKAIKRLGVSQVLSLNMEADDLAAIMTTQARARGQTVVLISGDKDWLQLVEAGVLWEDPIRDRLISHRNFQTQTDYANSRAFLQGKVLQGDSSDCIPGVGGLGEKAALALLTIYGSVEAFWEAAAQPDFKLPEELGRFRKKLLEFCQPEGRGRYAFNMLLMDLKTDQRPKPTKPTVTKGEFDREMFKTICGDLAFHSILRQLDDWLEPFVPATNEERTAA